MSDVHTFALILVLGFGWFCLIVFVLYWIPEQFSKRAQRARRAALQQRFEDITRDMIAEDQEQMQRIWDVIHPDAPVSRTIAQDDRKR